MVPTGGSSEGVAELGFMARMVALCSLPRTNPGNHCIGPDFLDR